jgi:hypothetical protein
MSCLLLLVVAPAFCQKADRDALVKAYKALEAKIGRAHV